MAKKEVQDYLGNTFESICEMCRQYNIPENRFRNRINRGWDLKDALLTGDSSRKKASVDHLGNEFETQGKMCEYWGVDESVYRQRIKLGFTIEKALTKDTKNTCVDHLGNIFNSLTEMCTYYNVNISTFITRRNVDGLSLEEALTRDEKKKVYDFEGNEFKDVYAMCKHYGVSKVLLDRRMSNGYSLKDALTIKGKCNNRVEDHLGNVYPNFKAMCEKWDRSPVRAKYCLDMGGSLYEALEGSYNYPLREEKINKKQINVTINKEKTIRTIIVKDHLGNSFDSFDLMCKYYGLKPHTVRNRIRKYNYTLEKALTKKVLRNEKDEIDLLCKEYNRPVRLVKLKLKEGVFTLEELLSNTEITRDSVKDHLGNIYKSKGEMCKYYGLTTATLKDRLKKGESLEDALTINKFACVDHLGNKFETQTEMCKHYGISLGKYKDRIDRGYSVEEALTNETYFQFKCTDFNGVEYHSLKEMCKAYGVTRSYYKRQLSKGLTQREALTPTQIFDYKGNAFASIKEMCLYYGITTTTYYRRQQEGMSLKEILITPDRGMKSCEDHLGNQFDSLVEMAYHWGVPANRLKARLNRYGFTLGEALTCPVRLSLGEYRIKHILDKKNITYLHNVTVKTVFKYLGILEDYDEFMELLLNQYQKELGDFSKERLSRLRYDFTLLKNDNIHSFIEFDGKQHFQFVNIFFKTLEEFLFRHSSDEIKSKLATYSNIPLLRIRYDQIDFCEEMIDDLLKNPKKYIKNHNTYLSEEEYWEDFN